MGEPHHGTSILHLPQLRRCQNAESNENSSSKIEEVPKGRRSMITQNKLTIKVFL